MYSQNSDLSVLKYSINVFVVLSAQIKKKIASVNKSYVPNMNF